MESFFFYRDQENRSTPQKGPLRKLKVAIQPNISVAGWPTEAGSQALAGFEALEDAAIVERLSSAGAAFIGSTRMSEFGFGLKDSMAGGALQAQVADAELVLDQAGEARLAAARAGVCGFKPSYGLISRLGLVGLIPSMKSCGILSANMKSIREILQTIAGPDERDFSLPDEETPSFSSTPIDPKKTTLGVVAEVLSDMPPAVRKAFDKDLDELRKAGFSIKEVSFPKFSHFLTVHRIVGSVEASSCAGRYDSVRYGRRAPNAKNWNEMYLQSRGAAFGTLLKSYLFQGAFFQFERFKAYEDACRLRARLVSEMRKLAAQADFMVLPVVNPAAHGAASGAPESLADLYAQFAYTAFANVTGQPALCLPSASAAPHTAFQLTGPRLSDGRLIDLGEYLLNSRRGGK